MAKKKVSKKSSKTFLLGRDSKTGEFVSAREVYKNPSSGNYIVERISKDTSIPKGLKYVVAPKSSRTERGKRKKTK